MVSRKHARCRSHKCGIKDAVWQTFSTVIELRLFSFYTFFVFEAFNFVLGLALFCRLLYFYYCNIFVIVLYCFRLAYLTNVLEEPSPI